MRTRPLFCRSALCSAALLAMAPQAFAADYIFSTGLFVPGTTAPQPLLAGDVLQINAGGFKYFDGVSFTNQSGLVNWNANSLYLQGGAVISNQSVWDAKGDDALVYNGGATPTFSNSGTFRKSGGTGNTTIGGIAFINSGIIDAQTGTILFNGGNATFNAGSQFTGAGVTRIGANAAFNGAFTSSNLTLSAGTFTGGGATIGGTVAFTGGRLAGTWEVGSGHTLSAGTGGFKYLDGAATVLTNKGTIDWGTTNSLYFESGASLINEGLFVASESMTLSYNGGALPTFTNTASGTLRAAADKTLSVGAIGFTNNGGTLDAAAGGSIVYNGGNATFNAGTKFTGAGSNVVAGNAAFNGQFDSTNLVLQSGNFIGDAARVNGNATLTGGAFIGTWEVATGHTLSVGTGGFKYLSGAGTVLTNKGTIDWSTTNSLYLQSGASLVNEGLFVASESMTLSNNGGAVPSFTNAASGTLRAAADKTLSVGTMVFTNNGGTLNAGAGGSIVYNGGNATFNAGTRFTGAGSNVVAGNAAFNGQFDSANLVLQSGNFTGDAARVNGNATLTGGAFIGTWEVATGHTLSVGTGGFKYLSGAGTVLTNKGTIDWGTTNSLYLQSGASLVNEGLFVANESMTLSNNGGAVPAFTNAASGTLRAAADKTLSVGTMVFANNGGTLNAAAGGSIVYNGGNATFNAGTQFTGAGSNVVANNARFVEGFTSENLRLQGGTFTGGDGINAGSQATLTAGTVAFTGGRLAGAWQVNAGTTVAAADGGFKYVDGATLVNQGTIAWGTGNALYVESGARIDNQGRFDFQADAALLYNGGAVSNFVNNGLIVKTAGSGTSTIGNSLGFDNRGVVDVQTGTIRLPDNFTNNGTLMGVGAFTTNLLTNAGHLAPGGAPGTLTLNGNYAQTAAGFLDTELASGTLFDVFLINGSASLDGTLALSCVLTCALNDGDVFVILDATGNLTGTFSNVTTLNFGQGFQYEVVYDYGADLVKLQVVQAGVVPEPETWALMLAGLAGVGMLARRRRSQG